MADISRLSTPITNKNIMAPVKEHTSAEGAAVDFQDMSKVLRTGPQSELLQQNNGNVEQQRPPSLMMDLMTDPKVTVGYIRSIMFLREIVALLPQQNQSFTEEIQQLFAKLHLSPAQLPGEMVQQENASTAFKGELFDFLRNVLSENPGAETKSAVLYFLKAVNSETNRADILAALSGSFSYLSKELAPSKTLAAQLADVAAKFRQGAAEPTRAPNLPDAPQAMPLQQTPFQNVAPNFAASGNPIPQQGQNPVPSGNAIPPQGQNPMPDGSPIPQPGQNPVPSGNAIPQQGQNPLPDGSPIPQQGQNPVPNGNAIPPQGQNPMPNGNLIPPQGQNPLPDGNPIPQQGQNPLPDGNAIPQQGQNPMPDGNAIPPQGQVPVPDGNPIPPQGQNPVPDGNAIPQQGENPVPNGNPIPPQGQVPMPDGSAIPPQGQNPVPNGNAIPQQGQNPVPSGNAIPQQGQNPLLDGNQISPQRQNPLPDGNAIPPQGQNPLPNGNPIPQQGQNPVPNGNAIPQQGQNPLPSGNPIPQQGQVPLPNGNPIPPQGQQLPFSALQHLANEALANVEKSILYSDKTARLVSLAKYNLSRYNSNTAFLEEASNRLLELLPDDGKAELLQNLFLFLTKHQLRRDAVQTGEEDLSGSQVMNALTDILEKQTTAAKSPQEVKTDAMEGIVHSILSSPSNFTPLLHFLLPVQDGDTSAMAEMWVNPDEEDTSLAESDGTASIHMLVVFDIDDLGRFETEIFAKDKDLRLSVFCPPECTELIGGMTGALRSCVTASSYHVKELAVKPLEKPRSLVEVFPALPQKRTGLYAKI